KTAYDYGDYLLSGKLTIPRRSDRSIESWFVIAFALLCDEPLLHRRSARQGSPALTDYSKAHSKGFGSTWLSALRCAVKYLYKNAPHLRGIFLKVTYKISVKLKLF
ncbi:hypothetical protein, partial [Escherichia coli]|uniref:hypothetical protein n=1 Tax=Escherichia coli TaxID=562 RepID=UPI001BC858D2